MNYVKPPFYMKAFWNIITSILDVCKAQILDNNVQFLKNILAFGKMTINSHKNLQNTATWNPVLYIPGQESLYFGLTVFQFIHSLHPPLLRSSLQGNQVSEEFLNTFRHCKLQILLSKVWKWQGRSLLKAILERTKVNRKMSKALDYFLLPFDFVWTFFNVV